jgi:2-polyprenyl-3-methyl-5-hydroxy-6-metoxy-1,4-benzoquinol methylase
MTRKNQLKTQYQTNKISYINCKICGQSAKATNLKLSFRESKYLPSKIELYYCADCEFVFTHPSNSAKYKSYYSENQNDLISLWDGQSHIDDDRYNFQVMKLTPFLKSKNKLTIVDIGCGSGILLLKLKKLFPNHNYIGIDPYQTHQIVNGILFTADDNCFYKVDIAIFSHTAEHLTDFRELEKTLQKIKYGGIVYVEVPDASRYSSYKRKEFLYHIDRLHVNHFSIYSLYKLLKKNNFQCEAYGANDFEYKDGALYPAAYFIGISSAAKTNSPPPPKQK